MNCGEVRQDGDLDRQIIFYLHTTNVNNRRIQLSKISLKSYLHKIHASARYSSIRWLFLHPPPRIPTNHRSWQPIPGFLVEILLRVDSGRVVTDLGWLRLIFHCRKYPIRYRKRKKIILSLHESSTPTTTTTIAVQQQQGFNFGTKKFTFGIISSPSSPQTLIRESSIPCNSEI